jgi:hypothetical protein
MTGLSQNTNYYWMVRGGPSTTRPAYIQRGQFRTGTTGTTDVVLTHPSATATTMTLNYGTTSGLGSSASNTACVIGEECRVPITGATKGLLYFNWNGGGTQTTVAR